MTVGDYAALGKAVYALLEKGVEFRDREKLIKLIKNRKTGEYEIYQAESVNSIYQVCSTQVDLGKSIGDFIKLANYYKD